jgi:acyl CoA:acetate/3-ketoacid CoA transferase beta subunit
MTDLGLFEAAGDHFIVREHTPGFTLDEIQAVTEAPLVAAPDMREVQFS